jgi:hypothetical protein
VTDTGDAGSEPVHKNVQRVIDAGRARGLEVRPKRFPEGAKTAIDAANAICVDVGQIVKSLIFGVDGEIVLAHVGGGNRPCRRSATPRTCACSSIPICCSTTRCAPRPAPGTACSPSNPTGL